MTTVFPDAAAMPVREQHRNDMAALLNIEESDLADSVRLVEDLGLDSLAMLRIFNWLEERGLAVDTDQPRPMTVGELLRMLESAGGHGVSIRLTDDEAPPASPTDVLMAAHVPATRPASALAPVLGTRTFRLEPIGVDDINFLYTLAVGPETSFRWRYRGAPPPVDRFVKELWDQVLVQFVVRRNKDNRPVGHVVCYSPDPSRRHAYVGAVFQPEYLGSGIGARIVIMFIRYLFHTFNFFKLYMEIPGFNWPQVSSGEGRLFHVEGILRDHECYAGRAWDKYLCAIYPDAERYAPPQR